MALIMAILVGSLGSCILALIKPVGTIALIIAVAIGLFSHGFFMRWFDSRYVRRGK